jgi:UDP-glucose 4-epimerase
VKQSEDMVVGGAGYIGSHFVEELVRAKEVRRKN